MPRVHAPVTNRKELERWRNRTTGHHRLLLTAYFVGCLVVLVVLAVGAAIHLKQGRPITQDVVIPAVFGAMFSGFCCFGPLAVAGFGLLLSEGLGNYKWIMQELTEDGRVCSVCGAVALFEDRYINPAPDRRHGRGDLVPEMLEIEIDGEMRVLCERCSNQSKSP